MFIGHFKGPFLIWSEFAVDIFENFASDQRGFVPSGFVIPKFVPYIYRQNATLRVFLAAAFFLDQVWPQCAHASSNREQKTRDWDSYPASVASLPVPQRTHVIAMLGTGHFAVC